MPGAMLLNGGMAYGFDTVQGFGRTVPGFSTAQHDFNSTHSFGIVYVLGTDGSLGTVRGFNSTSAGMGAAHSLGTADSAGQYTASAALLQACTQLMA